MRIIFNWSNYNIYELLTTVNIVDVNFVST